MCRAHRHRVGVRKLPGVPTDLPRLSGQFEIGQCDLRGGPADILNGLVIFRLDDLRSGYRLPDKAVLLLEIGPNKK